MKPKAIFLIRHGESQGNVDKSLYRTVPDWKIPLTPKGHKQSEDVGIKLRELINPEEISTIHHPLQVYCSPWYRTRQTKDGVLKGFNYPDIVVKEDPRIREQEWGNFQEKKLIKKIRRERHKYGSFFYRMPHGESGADVYDRVTTFIDTLHRDFDKIEFPPYCALISHGLTIRVFIMRWFHWTVEEFERYDTPDNCCLIPMVLQENNKYKLDYTLPLAS